MIICNSSPVKRMWRLLAAVAFRFVSDTDLADGVLHKKPLMRLIRPQAFWCYVAINNDNEARLFFVVDAVLN